MSAELKAMWVVRDHGVEGKAQPGQVVAVTEDEENARRLAKDVWAPSVHKELMLVDDVHGHARFVGTLIKVTR